MGAVASSRKIAYEKPHDDDRGFFFGNCTRFYILAISTLCLTLIVGNSLVLNFTTICMVKDAPGIGSSGSAMNATSVEMYDTVDASWLFSATAVGVIVGTIPITYLTDKMGFRATLTIYGLISGASTFLSPFAVYVGFTPIFIMRLLQGVALATSFPAMSSITVHWAATKGSGVYIALLSAHLQLGPLFTMPLASASCESSWGWPAIYYFQGAFTFVAFFVFYWFFTDSPRSHRNVSRKELNLIEEGKSLERGPKHRMPYRAMFTDKTVWGIFTANFGGMLGYILFIVYGPTYLNKALHYEVSATGFATAIPYLLSVMLKMCAGPLSDALSCFSQKFRMKLFCSLSQFSMAGCFVMLAILPIEEKFWVQFFFTAVNVTSALNCVGVDKCTPLALQQYAYIVQAINSVVNAAIKLGIPLLVVLLAPDNTVQQWSMVFWIMVGLVVIATLVFDFTAEGEPLPWTRLDGTCPDTHPDEKVRKDAVVPTAEERDTLAILL